MLLNLKNICGQKLSASDGDIGKIKDFYFDDKTWAVRYLVADTSGWFTGSKVLLSPYSFGRLDADAKVLPVRLTKKQIENSPSIDEHRPVSRQFEENYNRYYGWPAYWQGDEVWGSAEYPVMTTSTSVGIPVTYEYVQWDDIHLRSAKAVHGHHIEAIDGPIGTVSGFMVDDKTWTIRELVVETGHWYAGKEIRICPSKIDRISDTESKVYVSLTIADIKRTAEDAVAKCAA
jgi:hypothetical protein